MKKMLSIGLATVMLSVLISGCTDMGAAGAAPARIARSCGPMDGVGRVREKSYF